MHRVTNRHFDISGGEMTRVGRHFLISKLTPYEDFQGGPGWKPLLVIFTLSFFGYFSGRLLNRYEQLIEKYIARLESF